MYFTKESISVIFPLKMNFSPPQNLLLATKPERCLKGSIKVELTLLVQFSSRGPRDLTIQYTDMARFTEISDFDRVGVYEISSYLRSGGCS